MVTKVTPTEKVSRFGIRICGAAGDGLQSTGNLLQKYFNRLGYYVHGHPGTQSTIRGGHVWQQVEFSSTEIKSFDRDLDCLIALNTQSLSIHLRDMRENSFIILNSDKVSIEDFTSKIKEKNIHVVEIPMSNLAREIDIKTSVLANTVAIGALIHLLSLPLDVYVEVLKKRFSSRSKIMDMNLKALEAGRIAFQAGSHPTLVCENGILEPMRRIVISGNEMIALGAVASGLKFLAQYPITPASSILTYLSNRASKYGVVVRQAEDELAAICMIIGASYTGARAMTASSGPGISLMSEAFGYAAMTETPIVIVNSMRAGPSTGVPTKMEQADLYSAIYMSHGESPRAIFAPRSVEEAFEITTRAFNIADKFQIPVIILSDFALSERTENVEPFELDVEIDRGLIWDGATKEYPKYKRYQLTESGISPRAFPGTDDAMYILVGAEHDEESHSLSGNRCGLPLSEELREKMFHKRFKKLESLRQDMTVPEFYGNQNADHTILCWGSTEGAVSEAVDQLNSENSGFWNMLCFSDLFPLPYNKIRPLLAKIKHSIMFEVNYTGQFEALLHHHLDWKADDRIHPLGGETPTPSSVYSSVKGIMQKKVEVIA